MNLTPRKSNHTHPANATSLAKAICSKSMSTPSQRKDPSPKKTYEGEAQTDNTRYTP